MLARIKTMTQLQSGGWAIFGSILCFVLNAFLQNPFLGSLGLSLMGVGLVLRLRAIPLFGINVFSRWLFGFLAIESIFVALLVGWYLCFGLSTLSVLVVFSLVHLSVLWFKTDEGLSPEKTFQDKETLVWLGFVCVIDLFLIFLFFSARTSSALVSPWNLFSGEPFFFFGMATFLLLYVSSKRSDELSVFVSILHTFVALSVSAIMYGVGFGFDPFVHRAAEQALSLTGSIEPRQLLYSGQYVLVVALRYLTSLPLAQIDIWLVPILGSFLLPIGGYLGLKNGWGLSSTQARTWWMTMLLTSFMLMTHTVPFTFTYLFFILCLFLLPSAKSFVQQGTLLLVSLVLCSFHPLLAIPTSLLIFWFIVYSRIKKTWMKAVSLFFLMLSTACSVPLMLVVYQHSQGQTIAFDQMLSRLVLFVSLFMSPFIDRYPYIPWQLDAIYDLRYQLPMFFMALAFLCALFFWRKNNVIVSVYGAFVIGLIFAIFGTSTLFYFKDIIVHEQAEFALRLLQAWYIIALPFLAIAFAKCAQYNRLRIGMLVLCSLLVLHAWYFSYPQYNLKYPFFSPSVSAEDLATVQAIDDLSHGEPYLVLSNQMTSAAALQVFGFAHYLPLKNEQVLWYPIPTGGLLYKYYEDTIFLGPNRERIDELFRQTGAKHIFFVLQSYWPWTENFLTNIHASADQVIDLENLGVQLIHYYLN